MLSDVENVNYLKLVVCVVSSGCGCFPQKCQLLSGNHVNLLWYPGTQFGNRGCMKGDKTLFPFILEGSTDFVFLALDLLMLFFIIQLFQAHNKA